MCTSDVERAQAIVHVRLIPIRLYSDIPAREFNEFLVMMILGGAGLKSPFMKCIAMAYMHAHSLAAFKQIDALDIVGALLLRPVSDQPNCLFELSFHLGHCSPNRNAELRCAELRNQKSMPGATVMASSAMIQ